MAQELPNHHDFALTSVSVGDILYRRDSTHWANLHAGTAGQVLTTHGVGLAPSWADAGGSGDVSSAIILAPDSVGRNLIQPTTDANKGLAIQAHSNSQSAPLLAILGGAIDTSTTGAYLTVGSAAGPNILTVQDNHAAPSNEGLVVIKADSDSVAAVNIWAHPSGNADALIVSQPDGTGGFTAQAFYDPSIVLFSLATSTGTCRNVGNITPGFLDNTDASYKGRLSFSAYHKGSFAAREGLRLEDDGSAARIGFLGATAVARQTGGAATAGSTYTSAEQSMLQKAYSCLQAVGLLT